MYVFQLYVKTYLQICTEIHHLKLSPYIGWSKDIHDYFSINVWRRKSIDDQLLFPNFIRRPIDFKAHKYQNLRFKQIIGSCWNVRQY